MGISAGGSIPTVEHWNRAVDVVAGVQPAISGYRVPRSKRHGHAYGQWRYVRREWDAEQHRDADSSGWDCVVYTHAGWYTYFNEHGIGSLRLLSFCCEFIDVYPHACGQRERCFYLHGYCLFKEYHYRVSIFCDCYGIGVVY